MPEAELEAQSQSEVTKLPFWQMLVVCLVQLCEAMELNVLFPFMAFMVEDFGIHGARLGVYVGFLAAAFGFGQVLTSVHWGRLSDRYGRKPVMVLCVLLPGLCLLIFGTAQSYPQALLGRLLSGMLSGNLGVLRCVLKESTDDSNRVAGFGMLSLAWFGGCIVASAVGGMLAGVPRECGPHSPSLLCSVLREFPYVMPCLVCATLNATVALLTVLAFTETLEAGGSSTAVTNGSPNNNSTHRTTEGGAGSPMPSARERQNLLLSNSPCHPRYGSTEAASPSSPASLPGKDSPSDPAEGSVRTLAQLVADPVVLRTCTNYALLVLATIVVDETAPLFMKLAKAEAPGDVGGLGYAPPDIGVLLSLTGCVALAFTVLLLPRFNDSNKQQLQTASTLAYIPCTMLWPVVATVYTHYYTARSLPVSLLNQASWAVLFVTNTVRNCCTSLSMTVVTIQINNCAPGRELGAVNGLGQMMSSVSRCAGPAVGGALWAYSVDIENLYLNYIAVSTICLAVVGINSTLPPSLETGYGTVSPACALACEEEDEKGGPKDPSPDCVDGVFQHESDRLLQLQEL